MPMKISRDGGTRGTAPFLLSATVVVLALSACGGDGAAPPAGHDGAHGAPAAAGGAPGADPSAIPPGWSRVAMPGEREQRFGVRTEKATFAALERSVRTVGIVHADETRESLVRMKWSGTIEDVQVAFVGQRVRKGDPLFGVYSPDLYGAQQDYLTALRGRAETRAAGGRASAAVLAVAETLVQASRPRLSLWDVPDDLVERIEKTQAIERVITVRAPRDGTVVEREARPGLLVEPTMDLYRIADLSVVWVQAALYEYEAPLVRVGTKGRFIPVGAVTGEIAVVVAFGAPTVDPTTRTVKVRFEVENPEGAVRPGAYGTVYLSVPLERSLTVPGDAVLDTGTRRLVFVRVGEGLFEPREVRVGARTPDRVQVLSGISEGDDVVVRGQFLLDSESRLRSVSTEGAPAHAGH